MSRALEIDLPHQDERVVGSDEFFFSTTDRRGIIRAGNSVFARISAYSLEELIGSPHSIVRHPDMPSAVFQAMWQRLLSGRPMAGYVLNLAKDGRYYWVFATITPCGDGFLSVRMAPLVRPLLSAAADLYRSLLTAEQQGRAAGLTRPQAAAQGEQQLEQAMAALGLDGYDEFMMDALSAEMAARRGTLAFRPGDGRVSGALAEVLAAAAALDGQLGVLVDRLDSYRELSDAVLEASRSTLETAVELNAAGVAAQDASAVLHGSVPVLENVARVMVGPLHETVDTMRQAVSELDALRGLLGGLRFRIALARLHDTMVGVFASELLAGEAPGVARAEILHLCDALQEGVHLMAATMEIVNAKLASVSQAVTRTVELLNDSRRFVGKWRLLVLRHRVSGQVADYVDPIDQMMADGHDELAKLHELAARCRDGVFPIDTAALDTQLIKIRTAGGRL